MEVAFNLLNINLLKDYDTALVSLTYADFSLKPSDKDLQVIVDENILNILFA